MASSSASRPYLLLILLILHLSSQKHSRFAEARPLISLVNQESKYAKLFATLGMVCKCCDGAEVSDGGESEGCKASWSGSCSKLQCLPWKLK
nr:Fibropellin-1 like [Ipomoea batatas]